MTIYEIKKRIFELKDLLKIYPNDEKMLKELNILKEKLKGL